MTADSPRPLLTVLVPCYNEAGTISQLLERVLAAPYDKEVVVADDGSTDETTEILKQWRLHHAVTVVRLSQNGGKGAALRAALSHARGQFAIIQDADLEYDPQDYSKLLEPLIRGDADVVLGSRWMQKGARAVAWSPFRIGVSLLNVAVWILYDLRISDEACCYKAFRLETLRDMQLECSGFEFCPEVIAKACRMKLRIVQAPVAYSPRTRAEGKKIRLMDGWDAFRTLWRTRGWTRSSSPRHSSARLVET